jgi:hypothetical protein
MTVKYTDLKKWSKEFGIGKFGESKKDLIKNLKKYMKNNLDDLDEDQREWYSEQIGEKVEEKSKKKKKKEKDKVEPEAKKKKKKKEKEPEEEYLLVKAGKEALKEYAEELDISIEGHKEFDQDNWEELANKIFAEVDDMDDDDREELSKELFAFYATIKGQQDEVEPEEQGTPEIEVPKKIQLKRWSALLGVKVKGKEPEEIAQELLEEFKDVDEDDKKELPDSLVKWANAQFGVEEEEEEIEVLDGVEEMTLPDYATLKGFCREVGFKLKDIKKADKHPPTLVEMIMDTYDEDNVDDYSAELIAFVASMAPAEGGEPELEEEDEIDPSEIVAWLVEAGYDESDVEKFTYDQLVAKLVEDYGDKDDREDLPEEAIDFLKENNPELFEKKKVKKKKKKLK